ncbi:MAG: EAL domain-containing protein [Mycobacterium sp.]|nr:EAL domain-containing protein [Mycobacterium sp.]
MDTASPTPSSSTTTASGLDRERAVLAWWGRAAVVAVFVIAALDLLGWATGIPELTRILETWPRMPPWSAALLMTLAAATAMQLGHPSPFRTGTARTVAAIAGVLAVVFLAEYVTGRSFGLDRTFFPEAVRELPDDFPGRRPSPRTLLSVLVLSFAVGLSNLDRRWARVTWSLLLTAAATLPVITVVATVFSDASLRGGQANLATLGVSLLVVATLLSRPDRNPVAWLLARPDRWPLVRLVAIFAALPIVVELSRLVFVAIGVSGEGVWVLSVTVATVAIGAGAFYVGQREQRLLFDKAHLSSQRAEAHRERFEAVLSHAPSAISVRDRDHRYVVVNQAFCDLFGKKSVADVIGRSEEETLPAEVVRTSRLAEDRILAGENFFEEESIRNGPDDIAVLTQRFPLRDATGEVTEMVTIRTDITYRKKALAEIAERLRWQETIADAIRDGRLLVYSQPIVDIATREQVGEELLIRLRAANSEEILAPNTFLPHCERHNLMPMIDRYMVRRAIELGRAGRCVNVNIAGQTFADEAAMQDIFGGLDAAGPQVAKNVVFEITETTAVTSTEMAKEFSRSMAMRGARVVLDDFGTGYGSFTELRHLKLSSLKIDQSFVRRILEDPDDERVVNTIIVVARVYGLSVVAEGVESEEILAKLAALGADRAQGYLFGKPAPVD